MTPEKATIYTIGHSDHSLEQLVALLGRHGVRVVVDVRSQPYSRWTPQFNYDTLKLGVERAGLSYVYLGDLLGGRPNNPALYDGEHPNYARMAASEAFREGLTRLQALARARVTAILCSEGDYHKCHRGLLITPTLLSRGTRVLHIAPDGTLEDAQAEPKQLTLF